MKNLGQVTENQDIARKQDIPTNTNQLTNGAGFITNSALSGYVPTSRTINSKALSGNISLTASDVGALSISTKIPKIYYGTSSTVPTTVEKVVSCADFLLLEVGAIITVRFTYANMANGVKLNVNDTGAKSIRYRNSSGSTSSISWKSYDSLIFRYSGTYWDIIGSLDTNTTYTLSSFDITATSTELNYCDGVTSNIQTQLDAKANISAIPTTTSQLTNDSGFITSADLPSGGGVTSVVGQTGDVTAGQIKTGIQTTNGGFAIGANNPSATTGGAIGKSSKTTYGGAVGESATASTYGGAVGYFSNTTAGGAIGGYAQSTTGFAGGYNAKATADGAVQLGDGTNSVANTLQFRSYKLVTANGYIPLARNPLAQTTYSNFTSNNTVTTLFSGATAAGNITISGGKALKDYRMIFVLGVSDANHGAEWLTFYGWQFEKMNSLGSSQIISFNLAHAHGQGVWIVKHASLSSTTTITWQEDSMKILMILGVD